MMHKNIVAVFTSLIVITISGQYYSQIGQDQFLNEHYFHGKKKGVFIDIGAFDGITHSNTYFFEKDLGWRGICFEPHPTTFKKLEAVRGCVCINACVAKNNGKVNFIQVDGAPTMLSGIADTYDPRHLQRLKHEVIRDGGSYTITSVPSVNVNDVLTLHNLYHIDFLSLDTEGNELEVLQILDFNRFYIYAIAVENNYADPAIRQLLESVGFEYVTLLSHQDEIYINRNLPNS